MNKKTIQIYSTKNVPTQYNALDDIGDFFKKVGNTFIDGFKNFGEGIAEGDFKKIFTGISQVGAPGLGALSGQSNEELKSGLEKIGKGFINGANNFSKTVKSVVGKIREGIENIDGEKVLSGLSELKNTHGETIVKGIVSASEEKFKTLKEALSKSHSKEWKVSDIQKAIEEGNAERILHIVKSLGHLWEGAAIRGNRVFSEIADKLNEFSDELKSSATKLEEDIKEVDWKKMKEDIEHLIQIDPEDQGMQYYILMSDELPEQPW